MEYVFNNNKRTAKRARVLGEKLVAAGERIGQSGSIEVLAEHQQVFYTLFGWWRLVNRSARVFWLLNDQGFTVETAPNVRSILEHTYSMMWLNDGGPIALVALAARAQEERSKMVGDLERTGWEVAQELDGNVPPTLTVPVEGDPEYKQFTKLRGEVRTFGNLLAAYGRSDIYPVYRYLTNYAHARIASAEAYIDDDGAGTLSLRDVAKFTGYADVIATTLFLIQAGHVISPLIKGDPLRRDLERVANDVGMGAPELLRDTRTKPLTGTV
ncbi:DUF5677 domain-containing protein [Microbispora hainanensis]|uniref:Uncharacterized protein n=1 Tax=Microbispora hainanensis TaxID=568844 RepID=A0ABZ1SN19_9ACTN|nr:DUF5677 domain-containing protein [Microbispora hainanensis]